MMLRIKTLTPVHIGTGLKIPGFAAIADGETVKILDIDKLAEAFKDDTGTLTSAIEQGKQLTGEVRERASKTAKYSLTKVYAQDLGRLTELIECIKNTADSNAYLPGSSIKGAIRTSILFAQSKTRAGTALFEREGRNLNRLRSSFEDRLTTENDDELMRYLKIGDSSTTKNMGLYTVTVQNLNHADRLVQKTSLYLEAIAAGEEMTSEINTSINNKEFAFLSELPNFCNEFASDVIANEKAFYAEYGEKDAGERYGKIEGWLKEARQEKNKFLLRVGWGCGNIGTSLNLSMPPQLKRSVIPRNARPDVFPKTRRLTSHRHVPFGWLLCTLEE